MTRRDRDKRWGMRSAATRTVGRLLTCTVCGDQVDLIEVPVVRVRPDGFVCGECQTKRREPS